MKYEDTWSRIDSLIRNGNFDIAREHLNPILKSRLKRVEKLRAAELCRRVGWSEIGVRLLHRIVRPSPRSSVRPKPEEQAEYAACLNRIGAQREALQLLQQVSTDRVPQAMLFEAYVHMHRWDFNTAIPLLEKFISCPQLNEDHYLGLVARVNLANALLYSTRHEDARELLLDLSERTRSSGHHLLYTNACELSAQNELMQGHADDAERWIKEARISLSRGGREASVTDALYIRLWQAILNLQEENRPGRIRKGLSAIRKEAEEMSDWETLRHCDLLEAQRTGDKALLLKLWFGSSSLPGFRDLVVRELDTRKVLRQFLASYLWNPGSVQGSESRWLDLTTGCDNSGRKVKVGQVPHRLLVALCSDFYRPLRLTELFGLICPDSHFNPESSPFVVYQALRRLEKWIDETGVPLRISRGAEGFRLETTASYFLLVPGEREESSRMEGQMRILKKSLLKNAFANLDVRETLGISRRSAQYLLKAAAEAGIIESAGRPALYRFAGNPAQRPTSALLQ